MLPVVDAQVALVQGAGVVGHCGIVPCFLGMSSLEPRALWKSRFGKIRSLGGAWGYGYGGGDENHSLFVTKIPPLYDLVMTFASRQNSEWAGSRSWAGSSEMTNAREGAFKSTSFTVPLASDAGWRSVSWTRRWKVSMSFGLGTVVSHRR